MLVSVIVPCYNSQKFIPRAINSVLAQTHANWELILVDNNSSDNTLEVIKSFEQQYPDRITVLEEKKKGAPAARNKGLFAAKGEWVQFLDADDELLPNKISNQLAIAEREQADVVAGQAIFSKIENGAESRVDRMLYTADVWVALITSQLGITSANMIKLKPLLEVNGWNETLTSSQEYNLMFEVMKLPYVKVAYDNMSNTIIYKDDSSISVDLNQEKFARIVDNRTELRLRIQDFLKQNGQLTTARQSAVHSYIFDGLMRNRFIVPGYVSKKMKELGMRVPIKVQIKDALHKIKRAIKG